MAEMSYDVAYLGKIMGNSNFYIVRHCTFYVHMNIFCQRKYVSLTMYEKAVSNFLANQTFHDNKISNIVLKQVL